VVADLKLPGKSGLELQAELQARESPLPVVIITAHGDVRSARIAFKSEAVDFLEKPFEKEDLLQAIVKALAREAQRIERISLGQEEAAKLAALTQREREILLLVGRGLHAKEIARMLSISPRTVEVHKSSMMTKLGARNVAELVRFAVGVEKHEGRS
jgi:two-component system, LuxR family, response regulator FixJ